MNTKFKWIYYEDILYKSLSKELTNIQSKYSNIEFYGMCLDCNAEYGEVLLHLNTEEDIYINKKEDKWDVGDWEYFDLMKEENHQEWTNCKKEILNKMLEIDFEEINDIKDSPIESFLIMVSNIANKLQNSSSITNLKRTSDFKILVVDHDEEIEEGFQRMKDLGYILD